MRRKRIGRTAGERATAGRRAGRRHALIAAAALAVLGCTDGQAPPAADAAPGAAALSERALVLGSHMRAAMLCGQPVSSVAQDRAAMIETAVLDLHQRLNGTAARDAYLTLLSPPAFNPRQRGRDRQAWCAAHRPDIARVAGWLEGSEGAAFAEQAEALLP